MRLPDGIVMVMPGDNARVAVRLDKQENDIGLPLAQRDLLQ